MRFAVYQVSRKGGREKNEDRMGYCYTRDAGLFALADGMGGHPEGEVASQLALQTLAALFQREAKPAAGRPAEVPARRHHRRPPPVAALRHRALMDTPRTTLVACVLQGDAAYWAHCGDSRLYLVRGDKLLARTRDHSYSELQETLAQVVPLSERFNRNVLFTCLGSPGKPVVDTAGPVPLAVRRPAAAVLRRPVGHGADSEITAELAHQPISDAVPELVERALRRGGRAATTSPCWRRVGIAEDADSRSGVSTQRSATRFSPPPSRPACWRENPARRAGRRRDRALDPRDQRGHPALVAKRR
jgi:PPM family protein phosphatase